MTEEQCNAVIANASPTIASFIGFFNAGDWEKCGSLYALDAVMNPIGSGVPVTRGRDACAGVWKAVMQDMGCNSLDEWDKKYTVIDENNVLFTAKWKMNKISGTIHSEHWRKMNDVKWELIYDVFEVEAKFFHEG